MTVGNLFNGIGGFALAAAWLKWENIMHCEIDPFCNRVMNYHFPNSFQHEDIRTTDFTIWRGKIDLLTGGFPCQPYSTAGKRKGTADDRHLWPEMLRAIREIQPRWIVGENVRGLINWNKGLVFDQVQADLEAEGYEVIPFLLPAAGVGAPHRRYRIWPVAYSGNFLQPAGLDDRGHKKETGGSEDEDQQQAKWNENGQRVRAEPGTGGEVAANPICLGQSGQGRAVESSDTKADRNWKASWAYEDGRWPTESPVCTRNDGLSAGLVDITVSDWAEESLTALGNAIVPHVAYELFKAIEQYDSARQGAG